MKILNDLDAEHLDYWSEHNGRLAEFAAPDNVPGCESALGVVTLEPGDQLVVRVAWKPEPDDLEALAAGGTIWLSTWGGLPPHMLEVQP